MKGSLLLIISVLALLSGCESKIRVQLSSNNYFPLKTGNYWIYTNYQTDPSGQEELSTYVDSIVVVKDTLISGAFYYILENYRVQNKKTFFMGSDLRTFYAGYLLDEEGEKLMSARNFENVLSSKSLNAGDEEMCIMELKMDEKSEVVKVPAGEFKALKRIGIIELNDYKKTKKESQTYYAYGVGKVMTKFPNIHSDLESGQKLLRYQVN